MNLAVRWCLLGTLLIGTLNDAAAKSKHINVNLDAKWADTPILLEAAEYLAKESSDSFWRYMEDLAETTRNSGQPASDEEGYALCLQLAGKLLSPLQLNLMKFSLSLRAQSPSVEMYNQMALEKKPVGKCEAFVEINNMVTCELDAMKAFAKMGAAESKPTLLKNDHIYPGSEDRDLIAILYAEAGTKTFLDWHDTLKSMASEGKITYILRHFLTDRPNKKLRLSGYGVELAIKNTEYKATDDSKVGEGGKSDGDNVEDDVEGFDFPKLKERLPEKEKNLREFRQHLLDSAKDLAPLKVWQLQDLSLQAAERVLTTPAEDQLRTLQDVSQNFPTVARSLVKTQVSDEVAKEIQKNQEYFMEGFGLAPGEAAMFINGLQADLDVYDVFSLLDTMRSEAKLMQGLYELAKQYEVDGENLMNLLSLDLRDTDAIYAVDMRDDSVLYLNDLEKDKRYNGWPGSVQDILRPTFPGMLRHIRKNFHHVVFVVNPADSDHKDLLKMAEAFLVHNAPVRIGVLFVVNPDPDVDGTQDAGVAMLRAFNYIRQQENGIRALSFITDVHSRADKNPVTPQFVREMFEERGLDVEEEEVFSLKEFDVDREQAHEFFERTGLRDLPQVLVNGVSMKKHQLSPDEFEEAVVSAILRQTSMLQNAVYTKEVTDRTDLLEYLMTRNNVMPRLNSRILTPSNVHIDLTASTLRSAAANEDAFVTLRPEQKTAAILDGMKYLNKKDQAGYAVTTLVVGDLSQPDGRALLYSAIKHLKHSTESRIGIIHNPTSDSTQSNKDDLFIPIAVQAAVENLDVSMAKSFITKLLKDENVVALQNGEKNLEDLAVHNMDFGAYNKHLENMKSTFLSVHRSFVEKVLDFRPGDRGVVTNGKVLGPLDPQEQFIQEDFDLLDKYTYRVSGSKVLDKLKKLDLDPERSSELTMRVAGLLTSVDQHESRKEVPFWRDSHSVIKLPPAEEGEPAYQVTAILDPTTRAAQKYAPVLMVLQQVANVNIKIFLNCREKLSEMPLKNFYRFVLEPELSFSVDNALTSGPEARFVNVPEQPLLTMGMDAPEGWLVESVRTPHDLDNIYLHEMDSGIQADYELEYLLLEGHCYDSLTSQPPRGLEFLLGTNKTHDMVDTIVMANLGYFQLKATPGVWNLRLRPGRSLDIYEITSHEFTDSPSTSKNVIAVMDSFKSKIIKVKVNKKDGMEREELLTEDEPPKGLWDSISSKLTMGTNTEVTDDNTINIFSVASGHLYERLLRIMMLSVLKHTKSNVKFWFLKNYLSPVFKDFIPHMAKEYGFQYELVQYKWPRWLHQQTEKQRMIWGYKILFLDVLFPLNINKIIFVDADQIVRTDLKELVDFDLEGAPYGYTPFCDSRKEMDGFRFWKSGYWANHLAGRKYHISALYVVDLKKFRKIAAGDRLRGQYQGLSQDPNSLSNLDQDLPNNMIHQVNIKSLPQEWLYCDTWCDSSELARAKTIDLCNNPNTKEPKLSAAVRLVPEWTDYDKEVKQLWEKIYSSETTENNVSSDKTRDDSNTKRTEL